MPPPLLRTPRSHALPEPARACRDEFRRHLARHAGRRGEGYSAGNVDMRIIHAASPDAGCSSIQTGRAVDRRRQIDDAGARAAAPGRLAVVV